MNLYIDIDGVILTKKQTRPNNILKLIKFIIKNYDCYWLTTHCRNGENKSLQYLSNFFEKKEMILFQKIKQTNWDALKTEGIDFDTDFIWLEDYPFEAEKKVLQQKGKLKSLIEVNLSRDNELLTIIEKIKKQTK